MGRRPFLSTCPAGTSCGACWRWRGARASARSPTTGRCSSSCCPPASTPSRPAARTPSAPCRRAHATSATSWTTARSASTAWVSPAGPGALGGRRAALAAVPGEGTPLRALAPAPPPLPQAAPSPTPPTPCRPPGCTAACTSSLCPLPRSIPSCALASPATPGGSSAGAEGEDGGTEGRARTSPAHWRPAIGVADISDRGCAY